ncbi:MAG: hypothetical protein QNI96_03265 [Woeseiaceae bacterium]|nr:hypothetical protein [Woeseiaceae bacterium]
MTRTLFVLMLLVLSGCSVNEIVTAEETKLVVAEAPPDEAMLLDIGVVEFRSGLAGKNDPDKSGIFGEIRDAEVRYLAYHLKTTLQGAGHWGAVRVIPSRDAFTDVTISGEIKKSDGEFIELEVTVHDSAGNRWYSEDYKTQTGISSYSESRDKRQDPYQKVFNDIANDLQAYVQSLPPKSVSDIRKVTELRFFADMSPSAYGEHLSFDNDGVASITRLPAENDPSVARLRQIRERDRLVVDTLNEHYANFYYGIAIPYHSWRKTAREESVNYRQVKRSAMMQTLIGAVVLASSLAYEANSSSYSNRQVQRGLQNIGIAQGLDTMVTGITRRKEAAMHREAIKELSESFGAEAAPMVVTVEGETRRLTGTAAAQYESWRRLLKQIYEAETGFVETADNGDADPVRIAEPTG